MANTSSRTLRLLSLLQARHYWTGPELAERLGVSPRTLRRDVDRLRELGYPVRARPGVEGGYQLSAGAALPPLVVDDEEAVALAVGLQLAAQGQAAQAPAAQGQATQAQGAQDPAARGQAGHAVAEAAARALAKVTQVMPPRLRRQVEAVAAVTQAATWDGPGVTADPQVLARAAVACRDCERVRFGYTAASGERSERHVEPHRLVALDRRWYLVGYDLGRADWRSFRLDRLAAPPEPDGTRFRPRQVPGGDAAEFVRRGIVTAVPVYSVEAELADEEDHVREKIGRWATVAAAGQGRSLVRMTVENLEWAVLALAMAGAEFRVIAPPQLAAQVREVGARFSRASADSGQPAPA